MTSSSSVSPFPVWAHPESDALILVLWVKPGASRTGCGGVRDQALELRVAAPPVDGKANREAIRFLAKTCGVPRSAVEILHGAGSRAKRLRIAGDPRVLLDALREQLPR